MAVKTWEDKYEIARSYYQEHGNLLVPDKHIYGGINLGNWIYLQRKAYKDGKLQENRISMLMQIGMVWDVLSDKWAQMYEVAALYYRETGSLLVNTHALFHGEQLGKWVSYHRMLYAEGKLSQERVSKLEQIGMIWDASKNNIASSFPEQAIFYYIQKVFPNSINRYKCGKQEIDVYIPELNTGIEYDGFGWHQDLDRDLRKNKQIAASNVYLIRVREDGCPSMPYDSNCTIFPVNRGYKNLPDVIESIIELLHGECTVDVDLQRDQSIITANYLHVYDTSWDTMYQRAKSHFEQHGDLSGIKDKELKDWIRRQRSRYTQKQVPLRVDQIDQLNAIGMVWFPYKEAWNHMYSVAQQYYSEIGDLNIPTTFEYNGEPLGSWISTQRIKYRDGKLPRTYIEKLNRIGMIWDATQDYDAIWMEMYELAKIHFSQHGALQIKQRDSKLGRWINTQRTKFKNGSLSQDRIHLLDRIGMVWNENDAVWDKMYGLACKYYEMHGNLMVGAKEQFEGENLGPWLKWQCTQRNALTTEQISALEAIGIVWHRNNAKWDTMFELASEYYAEHGNLLVNTHSLYKGQKLGQWINCMRIDYMNRETASQNEAFTLERMQKLESIGMVWDVREWQWEQMYAAAKAFYEQHGHLKVTIEYDSKLKKWLDNQRSAYRGYPGRKPITKDHEDKLTAIGMIW